MESLYAHAAYHLVETACMLGIYAREENTPYDLRCLTALFHEQRSYTRRLHSTHRAALELLSIPYFFAKRYRAELADSGREGHEYCLRHF